MAEQPTMHAVFVRGNDQPVAMFADADQAARYGRDHHGAESVVVPVEGTNVKAAADTAAEALPPATDVAAAEAGTTADPHAALRGEIRAQLVEARLRARITKEEEADLAKEDAERPAASESTTPTVSRAESSQARRG